MRLAHAGVGVSVALLWCSASLVRAEHRVPRFHVLIKYLAREVPFVSSPHRHDPTTNDTGWTRTVARVTLPTPSEPLLVLSRWVVTER